MPNESNVYSLSKSNDFIVSPMVYLYLVTSEVEFKTEVDLLLAQSTIPELKPLPPPPPPPIPPSHALS